MTLRERLAAALDDPLPHAPVLLSGDFRGASPSDAAPRSAAAVLIAVTDRSEPGLILTQRTEHLRNHAGQIAFPGGRIDETDADAIAAALREAQEEIALSPGAVTVIGTADRYRTGTGFDVTPVLGIIAPDLPLIPSPDEVEAVFEVPLAFALDPSNHFEAAVEWQGHDRHYFEILWGERRIWGATAAMIVNLSRRLQWTQ